MCDVTGSKPGGGPRLCTAAQILIVERMVAGDSNQEVRQALKEAGHCSDLSAQTFSTYRSSGEVREGRRRALAEAKDCGALLLSKRLEMLNTLFEDAYSRLMGLPQDDTDMRLPPTFEQFFSGLSSIVQIGREISRLIDPIDETGATGIPAPDVPHRPTSAQVRQALEALAAGLTAERKEEPPCAT